MNPLQPFDIYNSINYDIASDDEFDELNAEDVGSDGDSSSEESMSNGSFVVDDDFVEEGEGEGERDLVSNYKQKLGYDRWIKEGNDLQEY